MIKIIFLVMAAFGESHVRVEDGTPVSAQNNLSRSVALMLFSHGGNCSASFLTTKMLVTAAHCTRGVAASSVRIMIRDSKGAWQSAEVGKLITHPQFVQTDSVVGARIKNDIGLVQLKNEFSVPVRPLKIGSVGDMVTERDVTVVGYGWNVPNSGARTLRSGVMRGQIQSHYNFFNREGIYMVPKISQAVCPGDSGGAVLKGTSSSMLLIGVNSLSNGCKNSSDTFSISEIVIDHKAWIKKYIPSI